jgi:hypothetical protein
MTDTAVLVNTIWQPRLAKGPKPMRMGERKHHMALHRCRGKRWGRGKSCAGNRLLREAISHPDPYGRSWQVDIGNKRTRHKIESTGAKVGDASVGEVWWDCEWE